MTEFKEWNSTTVLKKKSTGKPPVPPLLLHAAQRVGAVVTMPKLDANNKQQSKQKASATALAKIEQETEVFRRPEVSAEFRTALTQARVAKQWKQEELAKHLAQKVSLVKEYESGKTVPALATVAKLNRLLGVTLPKPVAKQPKVID